MAQFIQHCLELRYIRGPCFLTNQTLPVSPISFQMLAFTATALLAFSQRNLVRTQQLLDELAGLGVSLPEASELRARIALEQGNAQFALRFLDSQIRLHGDHPGLRETYASALFVTNRWDEAQAQLAVARQLGAPVWRIAYGEGLIEESKGNFASAKSWYEQALQQRPKWTPAESRLRALVASGRTSQ